MTPDEHYTQAEDLEEAAWEETDYAMRGQLLAAAQVHATLATISTPPLGANP